LIGFSDSLSHHTDASVYYTHYRYAVEHFDFGF
jgi:hypothetical protein